MKCFANTSLKRSEFFIIVIILFNKNKNSAILTLFLLIYANNRSSGLEDIILYNLVSLGNLSIKGIIPSPL